MKSLQKPDNRSDKFLTAAPEPKTRPFYEFDGFRLEPAGRILSRRGVIVPLTPKAFDTLLVLVENSGHVVSKDELMKAIWADTFVEEGGLTRNISSLRKALEEDPAHPHYIETVPKCGYRFFARVRELSDDGGNAMVVEKHTFSRIVAKRTLENVTNGSAGASKLPFSIGANQATRGWQTGRYLLAAALVIVGVASVLAYL